MNDEALKRLQRLDALFEEVLTLPHSEREAFLEEACAGDDELRQRLEKLLSAHEAAGPFLEDPAVWLDPLLASNSGFEEELINEMGSSVEGMHVGPYQILRQIGHGGMGAVYLAEHREEQFQHQVALKLIRPGSSRDDLHRRFLNERQILAHLQHPNIARLLDAGVTETGQPYFAMEYVDGVPLDQYCDDHCLEVGQRLRFFCAVCEAVHYAHQNLVVHRDLKPSNILVTQAGEIKLLDFGIAKLLVPEESTLAPSLTRTGMWVMTPEYASPEQVRGETITTASDVYALGVILYELLTGHRPYQMTALSPSQIERVICETIPARPSTAVSQVEELPGSEGTTQAITPEEVGQARNTPVEKLRRRLSGDLDTIVLKALQKEPIRRYASVEQFMGDILRHLEGLPVLARPDTFAYRASKFVKRHRVGVGATGLMMAILIGGVVAVGWQARIASQERDRARLGEAKAEEVSAFLIDLFRVADPSEVLGDTITAREILDKGSAQVKEELAEQPAVQATMMDVMGQVYQGLGLYGEAAPLLEEALAIRRDLLKSASPEVAQSLSNVARLRYDTGDHPAAESLYRESLAIRRALYQEPHADLATTLHDLAGLLGEVGTHEEAEALYREALAMYRSVHGDQHPEVASALFGLATLLHTRGDFDGAEQLFREAVVIYQGLPTETPHPLAAASLQALGQLRSFRRDFEEAEPLLREALAMRRVLYGSEHPEVLQSMRSLAVLLHNNGDSQQAEPLFREALNKSRGVYLGDHVYVRSALQGLGGVLRALGHYEEAEPLLQEVVTMSYRKYGDHHAFILVGLLHWAECLYLMGHYDVAEMRYREALAMGNQLYGEEHSYIALSFRGLARVFHIQGDYEAADSLYRQDVAMSQKLLRVDHRQVSQAKYHMANLLRDQGQYAAADSLYREALSTLRRSSPESHISLAPVMLGWGDLLTRQAQPERAEPLLREALDIWQVALPADHWQIAEAKSVLGASLIAFERYEEAESLLVDGYTMLATARGGQDVKAQSALGWIVDLYVAWDKPIEANRYRMLISK